jgi:hypothetical protein
VRATWRAMDCCDSEYVTREPVVHVL